MRPLLLVNANAMRPPVGPVALDYLAASLNQEGLPFSLLDLALEADPEAAVTRVGIEPCLVAMTVRNTDDCYYATQHFLLDEVRETLRLLKRSFSCPLVLGGAGFSIAPEAALSYLDADMGIWGEGELALPILARALESGADLGQVPGLLWRFEGHILRNNPVFLDLSKRSLSPRAWIDNRAYHEGGGMAGIETSRGCSSGCIYCADPLSKGRSERFRDPRDVAEEARSLISQGISHVHLCDSEFNRTRDHVQRICEALRPLASCLSWYTYASPVPFDDSVAAQMARAGCIGINFGVDAANDPMLRALGRAFRVADIWRAVRACRKAGIRVMLDLLLAGPGETESTIRQTLDEVRGMPVNGIGLSIGLRVYPGTRLASEAAAASLRGKGQPDPALFKPTFYVSEHLPSDPLPVVAELVRGDPRFFLPVGAGTENYNYDGNADLEQAIAQGQRGAFWDILLRMKGVE